MKSASKIMINKFKPNTQS